MSIKKTLVVIKSITKARDPGGEVENDVINSDILNSEPFSRKLLVNFQVFFCLGFNARIIFNLVSIGFPLFDMKRYLFCRLLSHVN